MTSPAPPQPSQHEPLHDGSASIYDTGNPDAVTRFFASQEQRHQQLGDRYQSLFEERLGLINEVQHAHRQANAYHREVVENRELDPQNLKNANEVRDQAERAHAKSDQNWEQARHYTHYTKATTARPAMIQSSLLDSVDHHHIASRQTPPMRNLDTPDLVSRAQVPSTSVFAKSPRH
ncbi:hypothetical protein [Mycobacterium sp.]|uniref:hypothetical protein n=1 Tax=Mycobacterium sp. TaxID=1785 RepID=UPI003BAD9B8E